MANEQDISGAAQRCREALEAHALAEAKAGMAELCELAKVFEQVRTQVGDAAARERVEELQSSVAYEIEELRPRIAELEIDLADPRFEERVRAREQQKAGRESAEKAKAAQFLQGLGGPFAALAGLANLVPGAGAAAERSDSAELACPSCQTSNPRRAKFCMECGKPLCRHCLQCGAELGKARFCPECGTKAS